MRSPLGNLVEMPPSISTGDRISQSSGGKAGKPVVVLREQPNIKNQIRIARMTHRQISNLIKLGRYEEAAYRSNIFGGILRTWEHQSEKSR